MRSMQGGARERNRETKNPIAGTTPRRGGRDQANKKTSLPSHRGYHEVEGGGEKPYTMYM